jgi:acetylornithine deacetylase
MTATPAPTAVVELLRKMVSFNTVNANYSSVKNPEAPLAVYLETLARGAGFETRRMAVPGGGDNLLVTHRTSPAAPWLMFESHLDTVVVDGMTIDPFAGRVEGGRMWGRGTCDTKGTGAAMFCALQRYAASPVKPNNIAIAFTLDEEYGMTGVRALVREWATLGFQPAGVIVGEPTLLRPIIAHNGTVRWRIVTRGIAAHAADPTRGRSAISDMMRVIDAVESRYVPSLSARHELTGPARCSVNQVHGGTQINIIPAQCEARIDRRVVPGESPDGVLPAVAALLEMVRAARPGLEFEQHLLFSCTPLTTRHNGSLLGAVRATLTKLGLDPSPAGVPYSTDAGELDAAGIPALVLGPGDIAQAHTKDEWIDLDQLHRGVDVYSELMRTGL